MQQWEYCAIVGINPSERYFKSHHPALWQFTGGKVDVQRFEGKDEDVDLAKTIARLGMDGWELVNAVPVQNGTHILYFKRPFSK